MATIRERVQAGAALLDKVLPDWWDGKETPTVDLEVLDMNSGTMCVLGQCFGDYRMGCGVVGVPLFENVASGFIQEVGDDYEELTAAWETEIRNRRKAAGHGAGE